MPIVTSNGIVLEFERSGPPDGAPLLLIHGVGAQLIRWPQGLIDAFAVAGFHVIRFDNRDVGLSTHMDDGMAYTLSDMAADAAGLLDALGLSSAHVVGVSLGGMVAQMLAIEHREKVRSMAIIMSQSGNPRNPASDPQAIAALSGVAPDPATDEEGFIRHSIALNRAIGSPEYPTDESVLRDFARRSAARSYDPAGAARQLTAGRGSPDRRAALATLDLPTLVIHGADDPLIKLAGGEDIARHVPRAWMLTLHGMGHDLPEELNDILVSAVSANARRAA